MPFAERLDRAGQAEDGITDRNQSAMQRKRDSLVPVAEALADLPGPIQALRRAPADRELLLNVAEGLSAPRTLEANS